MNGLFGFLDLLVYAIVGLFLATVACIGAVSFMPKTNPLHELLSALTKRLAVTLGLAIVTPFIEPIPLVDIAFDIGAPLYLAYTWISFLKTATPKDRSLHDMSEVAPSASRPEVVDVLPAPERPAKAVHGQEHDSFF